MANKPVKFLSDALFKKNILKEDAQNNKIFEVSGTLNDGLVTINVPLSASNTYIGGDLEVSGTVSAKKLNITEVNTSVIYDTSISASINALLDVSASNATAGEYLGYDGNFWVPKPLDLQGALDAVKRANDRLKYQKIDYFDANGYAEIILPETQFGGKAFPPESIEYILYDVSVRDGGEWVKHIFYSQLSIVDNRLHIVIEATALNQTNEYKLLAINTNSADYVI
jgi:hypothetical protein